MQQLTAPGFTEGACHPSKAAKPVYTCTYRCMNTRGYSSTCVHSVMSWARMHRSGLCGTRHKLLILAQSCKDICALRLPLSKPGRHVARMYTLENSHSGAVTQESQLHGARTTGRLLMVYSARLCAAFMVYWTAVWPREAMKAPTSVVVPPAYRLPPPVHTWELVWDSKAVRHRSRW